MLVLQVEGGQEGQAGGVLQHMQPHVHVARLVRAVRRQQALLGGALLRGVGGGVKGRGAEAQP